MPELSLTAIRMDSETSDPLQPSLDPLQVFVPMPYDLVYFPYGVPLRLRTNSESVAAAAHENWAAWKKRFDMPCVEVRLLVNVDSDPLESCPSPPVMRAQGHLLTITADAHNFACCDLSHAFAFGGITQSVAANHAYLRFFFLEAMAYSILSAKYMVFLHAACIASRGEAILLSGDSGAGKTSLSYACARRGWTFVSDDASVLWGEDSHRIILGDSRRFRFRNSAVHLFPELKTLQGSHRAWRGKPTLEVPTESLDILTASEARPRNIVFLKRHQEAGRKAHLIRVDDLKSAADGLQSDVWPKELRVFERNLRVIQHLLKAPSYELHYFHLEDAIDLLEQFRHRDAA